MRIIDESVFLEILENMDADICEVHPDSYSEWGHSMANVKDVLKRTPTIDPDSLVKRGRWENNKDDYPECTECGYMPQYDPKIDDIYYSPYCPSCGAKMIDGEAGEDVSI